MITAQLSLIRDGEAMNMCAVSFVVNCPTRRARLAFVLRTQHGQVWSEVTREIELNRRGYNFVFYYLEVSPSTYAELDVVDMTGIDVIYTSTVSAVSMVKV
jgi:hypothetical protein